MLVLIYTLCTVTSLTCAVLLLRGYSKTRYRLLYWAGLCFVGITATNILVVADKLVFLDVDLLTLRRSVTFGSLLLLMYGLIFDV